MAPWSLPTVGPAGLLGVALLLAGLTVWTYLGVKKATRSRLLAVLLLRMAALATVFGLMLRPSFALMQFEGVETSKLLVIFDGSISMNAADVDGQPTRWEQVNRLWSGSEVQHRLRQLAVEQKIEVVKYVAAEELRADEPGLAASGRRTDIGGWLHQLWQKHAHEKHLRGIAIFSDGADNGTRFSAQDKARAWRGVVPIHAFGVGDPANARFRKDIGLTDLKVKTSPVSVQAEMEIAAVVQAPGFEKTKVDVGVWFESISDKRSVLFKEIKDFEIRQVKDQNVLVKGIAPEEPGEYKVTLKITPHPNEVNKENNEISTYVHVIKSKINVLWVDRFRVWEPTHAIRTLATEPRFAVRHVTLPAKGGVDPLAFYEFDQRHYDVIVIGDVSAKEFSWGSPKVFGTIMEMVEKKKTGLLMLGGTQTFCKGGWREAYPGFPNLLPVTLDVAAEQAEFTTAGVWVTPTKDGADLPFLQLGEKVWNDKFDALDGIAPVGALAKDATALLLGRKKELVMAATRAGGAGRVVVFAGDSTHTAWRDNPDAVRGYNHFWKNLVFWLARQEDNANQLWINLDKRRVTTDAADALGFTFGLRGKGGAELPNASFTATVFREKQEFPVRVVSVGDRRHGSFQGAKEPGEYQLVIKGTAKDGGIEVKTEATARFLVAVDDDEMLRPTADHESLSKIAALSEGRFHLAQEQALLHYLDELKSVVNRESRQKTVHYPDWRRTPASESARDQLPALWGSFSLASLLLFIGLLSGEWGLRRWWGLV